MKILFVYDDEQFALQKLTEIVTEYSASQSVGLMSDNIVPMSDAFVWNQQGDITIYDIARAHPGQTFDKAIVCHRYPALSVDLGAYKVSGMVEHFVYFDGSGIYPRVKRIGRAKGLQSGMEWDGRYWQTRDQDRLNIAGRVAKLTALLALGDIQLNDTQYTTSTGATRPLMWRDTNNNYRLFTVEEYLRFGVAVDEFVEDKYIDSWN